MADTVRTEDYLLESIFQDGQDPSSITAQDMRDLIVSIKYLNGGGWEFHLDGEYTVGSPKVISAGVRTQITIDGVAGDFGHPATTHGVGHFWDTTLNKVVAQNLNSFATGRVSFVAKSVASPTNRFELEVDVVGGSFPIIYQDTGVLAKGAGVDQGFNFIIPLFVGPEFLINGATAFITPEEDMSFHTHAITINRTYIARP